MLNLLRKTAQVTYVPAIRGQSYRAAYCYKTWVAQGGGAPPTTSLVCTYYAVPGYSQSGGYSSQLQWVCRTVTSAGAGRGYWAQTCVPEQPYIAAVPGAVLSNPLVGWNAGARSLTPLPRPGHGQVRVPADIGGALVGLSDGADNHNYSHASHALLIQEGQVSVVERGATVFTAGPAPLVGTYRVAELPSGVAYFLDDVLLYRSLSAAPVGPRFLDATLYVTGDAVWDPVVGDVVVRGTVMDGDATVLIAQDRVVRMVGAAVFYATPLVDGARRGAVACLGAAVFRAWARVTAGRLVPMVSGALSTFAPALDRFDGALAAPRGLFSASHALTITGHTVAATMGANLGPALVEYLGLNGALPSPQTPMVLLSGENIDIYASCVAPRGLFGLYAAAQAETSPGLLSIEGAFAPLAHTLRFDPLGPNEFDAVERVICVGWTRPDAVVFLTVYDGLTVGTLATLTIVLDIGGYDAVTMSDSLSVLRTIQLVGSSALRVSNNAAYIEAMLAQYATNSSSGALSRYEGFGFSGFTRGGGESYGWRKDGVYRIGGETDNGALLRGAVDFGAFDFGSSAMNYLPDAFVGIGTDGTVFIRVTADDGQPVTYRVVGESADRRAKLSKGLRGRHWRVQLEVVGAGSAELYDVEFNVELAARRQTRRV